MDVLREFPFLVKRATGIAVIGDVPQRLEIAGMLQRLAHWTTVYLQDLIG